MIDRKHNCLNTIRLLAATQVMLGHACVHLNLAMPEWMDRILSLFSGVPVFFGLSGYLIWYSVQDSQSAAHFLRKRFFRIYPELWMGILIEMAVMRALYDRAIPVKDWILLAAAQGTVFQFWTPNSMRFYGCGVPNGSLWTICVLVQFYGLAIFLRKRLHRRSNAAWGIAMIVALMLSVTCVRVQTWLPEIGGKLLQNTIAPFLWLFLLGTWIAERQEKLLPIVQKYWFVFFGASALISMTGWEIPTLRYGALQFGCMLFALLGFAYRFPKINVQTDISYGLYIYHMIVINAMIALNRTGNIADLLLAMAISTGLACGSTLTIGNISRRTKSTNHA